MTLGQMMQLHSLEHMEQLQTEIILVLLTLVIIQRQQVFFLGNNLKMTMKNLQDILMVSQEQILIIKIVMVSQKHTQCMHH